MAFVYRTNRRKRSNCFREGVKKVEENNQTFENSGNINIEETPAEEVVTSERTPAEEVLASEETPVEEVVTDDVNSSGEVAGNDETPAEEGFYNVEFSEEEIERAAEQQKSRKKISAAIVASIALFAVITVVIVLIAILKVGDESEHDHDHGTDVLSELASQAEAVPVNPGEETPEHDHDHEEDLETPAEPFDYTDYGVEVTIGDYKGLILDVAEVRVTDEDLTNFEKTFLENRGLTEFREVTDRPAALNDTVVIDFDGVVDGEHHPKTTGTDLEITLGSHRMIDGFEDGIIGVGIGESKVLNLVFPDPYTDPDFAGKPVDFTITVKKISEKYYPELTDELISENTEYKTVTEYRDATKKDLLASKESEAKQIAFQEAVESLVLSSSFNDNVEAEINDRVSYYRSYYDNYFMQYTGVDALTYTGLSEEDFTNSLRLRAEPEVKYPYVYQAIAKAEGYSPTPEERSQKFDEIFYDMYGFENEEAVYKSFTKKMCDVTVENELLTSYGYNWLLKDLGLSE